MGVLERLGSNKDVFKKRMIQEIDCEDSPIFTEDLTTLAYITETKEDLDLFIQAIMRYHEQVTHIGSRRFLISTLLMRVLHLYFDADMAMKMFNNPDLDTLFQTSVLSYTVLMDMLYEDGQYEAVVKVYTAFQSRVEGFHIDNYTLYLAALYKMNTPEALKMCTESITEAFEKHKTLSPRALAFAAMLALKQNRPEIVMELIARISDLSYNYVNFKTIALCKLGRVDDAILILQSVVRTDAVNKMSIFTQDAVDEVEEAVNKTQNQELKLIFKRLAKSLKEGGLISPTPLEDRLNEPVTRQLLPKTPYRRQSFYRRN
ncbi:hypothetical protein CHS0354_013713 [Potamilus streckersoni]|uniref:Pentatricopeptide repeat-containing protein 2, mitochondrial n=1 Tax=Potamilus streckersoni TaxID=2493646 RepID=A0AAE0TFB3_9BIVA|nr:hypothetical protein CHS0354_013713 [Potamilus streckersoni]